MKKAVDIVILTCNKKEYTEFCLNGLLKTDYRPLRVILVDNGSEDGTIELITSFKKQAESRDIQCSISLNNENKGAIEGRNQALQQLEGDITIFMDNDVVPARRDWIQTLTAFMDSIPDLGAASPKLIYPDSDHLIQCAGCEVSPGGKVNFRGRGLSRNTPEFNVSEQVQALITACMAVHTRILKEVGEFDPIFSPVQFEDIDLCYRIKEKGYKLYYTPEPELYHFENITTNRTSSLNSVYNTVKNGLKFKKKWQSVFSRENGPDESSMVWRDIPPVQFTDIDTSIHDI